MNRRRWFPLVAALALAVFLLPGCSGKGDGDKKDADKKSSEAGKAFLDAKKQIPPRLEWNKEITSRSGGTFTFRVTSQGPFAVTLITDNGYKALQAGDRKGLKKADVLLTVDSKETTLERKATVPAGSSWFIIENQTNNNVEMRLQCFEP